MRRMEVWVADPIMVEPLELAVRDLGLDVQVLGPHVGSENEGPTDVSVYIGSNFSARDARVFPDLRLVHAIGAGIDGIDRPAVPRRASIATTGNHEHSVAEFVIMSLIALSRRIPRVFLSMREHKWDTPLFATDAPMPQSLSGLKLGILGVGRIGQEVARLGAPFGVISCGLRAHADDPVDAPVEIIGGLGESERLASEVDAILVSLPLTSETRGLVDRQFLGAMRQGALLVNVARGRIVDEDALFESLASGRLGGAALDVWYEYPSDLDQAAAPSTRPFWELDNVLMSPHVAGVTSETLSARARDIANNLSRMIKGQELKGVVP